MERSIQPAVYLAELKTVEELIAESKQNLEAIRHKTSEILQTHQKTEEVQHLYSTIH